MVSNICQKFGATDNVRRVRVQELLPHGRQPRRGSIADLTACGAWLQGEIHQGHSRDSRLGCGQSRGAPPPGLYPSQRRYSSSGSLRGRGSLVWPKGGRLHPPVLVREGRSVPDRRVDRQGPDAHYPHLFAPEIAARLASSRRGEGASPESAYEGMGGSMRRYFGGYAGYAQQYLYHYARMGSE